MEIPVIKQVNLEVPRGCSIVLFGPNGCGKTTLLRLISKLESPSAGEVEVNVSNPKIVPFVFQHYRASLLPWLDVKSNLLFPLHLAGVPREKAENQLQTMLKALDIRIDLQARVFRLSGGEAQKCCIVRALLANPELLLLDEFMSSLDFQSRIEMRSFVAALGSVLKPAPTIISVAHDISDAVYVGQKIIFLTERPSFIHKILPVDLPWPRPRNIESDPRFTDMERQAFDTFRTLK